MKRKTSRKHRQRKTTSEDTKGAPTVGLLGLPVQPTVLPKDLQETFNRVSIAALLGGGKVEDVGQIYGALLDREHVKRELRSKEMIFDLVEKDIVPMADVHYKRLLALKDYNERRGYSVSDEDRQAVEALNATLEAEFPKKSPRFEKIDKNLAFRSGRARYILEGPRKAKSKT